MSEMSGDKKERLIKAFSEGMTFEEAAQSVGVTSRTIYRWCADDPALRESVDDARCKADDSVESVTFKNCKDPDASHNTLRMFWLKSRRPEVYRETTRHEVDASLKSYEATNTPEDL